MALNVHITLSKKWHFTFTLLRLTLRRHLRLKCLPLLSFLESYRYIFTLESKKQWLQISQCMSKSKIKHIYLHSHLENVKQRVVLKNVKYSHFIVNSILKCSYLKLFSLIWFLKYIRVLIVVRKTYLFMIEFNILSTHWSYQ